MRRRIWDTLGLALSIAACSGKVTTTSNAMDAGMDGSIGGSGGSGDTNHGDGATNQAGAGASGKNANGAGGNGGDANAATKPAQAAVTLKVDPAPGKTCQITTGQLAFPSTNVASVLDALNCNRSAGCQPDLFVVQDRTAGAIVSCSVAAQNSLYAVSLLFEVDGSSTGGPSIDFSATGALGTTGGTLSVIETNSVAGGGGNQADCVVTIESDFGNIGPGTVWASFECANFRDPTNIGETGCDMKGILIFENCSTD